MIDWDKIRRGYIDFEIIIYEYSYYSDVCGLR